MWQFLIISRKPAKHFCWHLEGATRVDIGSRKVHVTSQLIQKFKNLRFLSTCPDKLLELLASYGALRRYVRTESVFM
jgi:hypothetical protein